MLSLTVLLCLPYAIACNFTVLMSTRRFFAGGNVSRWQSLRRRLGRIVLPARYETTIATTADAAATRTPTKTRDLTAGESMSTVRCQFLRVQTLYWLGVAGLLTCFSPCSNICVLSSLRVVAVAHHHCCRTHGSGAVAIASKVVVVVLAIGFRPSAHRSC
jgi:hypothetical protein